ncbi:hypothetical protein KKG41_04340 [Patescibacteria group bacterium]|nr:hypothetical protein [Patescibacteria group bacterium]
MNQINVIVVIVFLLIWLIIYNTFYSPKARIGIINRQIYRLPIKTARAKRDRPDAAKELDEMCNKALNIRYKMISALLDYHFDPDEDKEYIEKVRQNMPFEYRK